MLSKGDKCTENSFKCANDQCVPSTKVCDGTSDCYDGSDEAEICRGNIWKSGIDSIGICVYLIIIFDKLICN